MPHPDAEYDTHHGLTNAVLLPTVLRFNAPAITEKPPKMPPPKPTRVRHPSAKLKP